MFGLFAAYVTLMGTACAAMQVARGAVRGAGKLIEGDGRGALSEIAGGILAPARAVYEQVRLFGADACQSAGAITEHTPQKLPLIRLSRLRRRRVANANEAQAAIPAAAQ